MTEVDRIRQILSADLDPEFIESVAIRLAWEYHALYERLRDDVMMPAHHMRHEFALGRAAAATKALAWACRKHGVPFNFRRLQCNGQSKILVKIGRIVLIQEAIDTLYDAPKAAAYKLELADTHAIIRQLELDLGDQPKRIIDWSGSILGVVLHGAAGPNFNREHCALGAMMLGVPDDRYTHWVQRLDLTTVALYGTEAPTANDVAAPFESTQVDEVHVRLKRKKIMIGA